MKYSTVTNAEFASADKTSIACTVQFDDFPGPVPFFATANDPEPHGAGLYELLMAGEFGEIAPYIAPIKTFAEAKAELSQAVQSHLDSQAKALGYDDIKTAVTYADEPAVPAFEAQGKALRAWRSKCWEVCINALSDVVAGKIAAPTTEQLILLLPAFVAP